MPTPTPRRPKPTPLPPGSPRHSRSVTPARPDDSGGTSGTASSSRAPSQTVRQQRLQGAFLTIIGLAGLIGGVLFSIEAPRFTPVPVVFLTFWLVMVIVGKILFAGLGRLREAGVGAPAPSQVRAAAAVAGIVVAVGMMGFAATGTGAGVAAAAPCPGGGPATCGPTGPELTFTPPPAQTGAPGGQQGGQQTGGNTGATSPSPAGSGGDNGPGIQAQTPQFGTPGQQAPNIPGNEQPGQGGQRPQGNGQGQPNQNPTVQTTAPGGPQQTGQQQPGQQTQSGLPSSPTITVTKTESQCAVPGAGTPGGPGSGESSDNGGGTGPDNGDGENKDGAPSWAYLVAEATGLMAGGRNRRLATPGAVTSQLTSETLTDTTAATKASTEYYSSARINPSPSRDLEPPAPNTADAPPSHQPMQPPSTGSGNSESGPSSSPNPGVSSGQGAPVGTSPGQGLGTGSNNGSTPTPIPGDADPGATTTNVGWPDVPGVPDPGLPKPGSGFVEGPVIAALPAIVTAGIAFAVAVIGALVGAIVAVLIAAANALDAFGKLIPPLAGAINSWLGGSAGKTLDDLLKDLPEKTREALRKWLEENLPKLIDKLREAGLLPAAPAAPGGGASPAGPPTPGTATPDLPTPGNPGTPLPGQTRPPLTPKPTTPPDPGKIPAPGRNDPDTGLPVIPQQPRPSTTPQPGTGSAPSASNGATTPAPPSQGAPNKPGETKKPGESSGKREPDPKGFTPPFKANPGDGTLEKIAEWMTLFREGRLSDSQLANLLRPFTPQITAANDISLQGIRRPRVGDDNPATPEQPITARRNGLPNVSADHIIPLIQMVGLPGFKDLSAAQVYDLINWTRNLQWMATPDNQGKGGNSAVNVTRWATNPAFVTAQTALENSARQALLEAISQLVKGQ